jgi:hypothetical protein
MISIQFRRAVKLSLLTVVLCCVVEGASAVEAPVTTVDIIVNLDHNGEFGQLKCGPEEMAYRVTFPNLAKDFRLNVPNERVFVVDQVWVVSEILDVEDFNHRVDAVIGDTGALEITVRAFSRPNESQLANTGTADFAHYIHLAARLGDLSFQVRLKTPHFGLTHPVSVSNLTRRAAKQLAATPLRCPTNMCSFAAP